ncbi:MAG: LIC_13387 family protein [Mycobacterium sp.]
MTDLTWFRVGAWCWITTGAGHLLGDIALRTAGSTEIDDLMRTHSLDLMGTQRTYYQLMMSFSLAMGIGLVFIGILLLYVARLAPDIAPVAALGLAMSVLSLGMSVWLDPPPPIILFSVACVAFGLALRSNIVRRQKAPRKVPS